jgi:DNA end-binding protein Ku
MLDLAKHIVNQKASTFEQEKFEDHYEEGLIDLINAKRNGKTVNAKSRAKGENVVDLMDAVKKSIAGEARRRERNPAWPRPVRGRRRPEKAAEGKCSSGGSSGIFPLNHARGWLRSPVVLRGRVRRRTAATLPLQ